MDSTDGQAIAEASVDGRQYAIPAVEVETGSVQVLNVRQDWLDEYGLDAPKTLDDVENIAKVFAEKKPAGEDTIPLAGPDKNTKCYTSFLDTGTTTGGFDAVFAANGAYPGNCSSADFSAASPASRSVSASNSCPMMMHGAVTPAPFQPATLM